MNKYKKNKQKNFNYVVKKIFCFIRTTTNLYVNKVFVTDQIFI